MAGLVLEGGSLRGFFSAGVMDALLYHNIDFNYVIGVSAGIANGISYVSKQRGRNLEIITKYRNDHRYLSKRNFFKCRSIFGLDFVFDEIPNKLVPFDYEAYNTFDGTLKVGVTEALSGAAVYKDGKSMDKKFTLLRASCAIPVYFPPIIIDGKQYFDGGLSDSIPIKQSIKDGNLKNLVILTQPKGFQKEKSKSTDIAAFLYKRKFPALSEALKQRPKMYNDTIDFIDNLEEKTPENIVVIRPEYKLSSFESDVAVIEKSYWHGYELGTKNIEKIKALTK